MFRRFGPAAAPLIALLAVASFAGDADASPLVVFFAPDRAAPAASARERLAEASQRLGGAFLDLSPAPPTPPRAGSYLSRAIDAYHDFKYEEALEQLSAGLKEAATTGADGLSPSELSDFFLYRALVFTEQGDGARAWDDFVQAAVIAPSRRLDPVRFPPRVIEEHQRAVKAVQSGETSQITIQADDSCEARLDGHPVPIGEPSPAAFGEHYLYLRCPGALPYGARVSISSPEQILAPALRRPERPTLSRALALGRRRGATRVVFAEASVSADAPPTLLLLLAETSGKELGRTIVPLGGDPPADAAEALSRLLTRVEAVQKAEPPPPRVIVRDEPRPWYESPWLWGGVGVGVTAAILTPFLFSGGSDGFRVKLGGHLP